jgi:hypothetical protein
MNLFDENSHGSHIYFQVKFRRTELLNVHPCGFKPEHSNKLGNEFRLFTNYDPADRLGGWEKEK